jgi:glucokinase
MPGMTDVVNGVVIEAANLDKWVDVPARALLERELAVPVEIENDVNLAAIGERWRGGARGIKNLVFVSMGTGIGAGIVIDERLHRGHRWYAGEISHLNVDFKEWAREFGAAGYLESYLGSVPANISRRAKQSPNRLFDENAVLRLGAALANIATIIDPEAIVFGGAVALRASDFLEKVQVVAARIAPNCPPITLSELGEDAPLFGSVRVALDRANERLQDLINDRPVFAA